MDVIGCIFGLTVGASLLYIVDLIWTASLPLWGKVTLTIIFILILLVLGSLLIDYLDHHNDHYNDRK